MRPEADLRNSAPILTNDVDTISDVAFVAAPLVIALITACGCLAWLAWLSLPLSLIVMVVLVTGAWVQYAARKRGLAGFAASREGEDNLHKVYREIYDGMNEFKLNRTRRERTFRNGIVETTGQIRKINVRAINTFVLANAFGAALFFLLIALVLFWHRISPIPSSVLSGFVLVLLFLRGPVDQIMGTLPTIGRAQIALRHISDLSRRLAATESDIRHLPSAGASQASPAPRTIELAEASYAFPGADGTPAFVLGPIDLTIEAGRITFIVGDNGSGKTTLIKLLLGLYAPQSGCILVDGKPMTADDRDDYRQLFSTVLSNFHLFDELACVDGPSTERAEAFLDRLGLAGKTRVADGRFTTTDLSTGQRKRLALVHAYVEDRPVIVFDEWAADQDPSFRHLFYTNLLPTLRDEGRTMIVISHDDRYFDVADRIVRLENGHAVEVGDATFESVR